MRWPRIIILLIVLSILGAFAHYTLPQRDIVRITGTESVREEFTSWNRWFYADGEGGALAAAGSNRDIRFINTVFPDEVNAAGEVTEPGRVMVYRNEDTGFGWPPYFKLDTADLQAEATNLVSTAADPQWVAITHYGWRLHFPTAYPNAVAVRPVDGPDVRLIPWTNIVILLILAALIFFIWRMWERFEDRVIAPLVDGTAVRWAKLKDRLSGR
ncbi:hypothetical protein A8B78_08735 [Jannaschia sp. EhC01]|nr:hypothetical protein A8B78_08735 [Jannaschia sp. EhC01]